MSIFPDSSQARLGCIELELDDQHGIGCIEVKVRLDFFIDNTSYTRALVISHFFVPTRDYIHKFDPLLRLQNAMCSSRSFVRPFHSAQYHRQTHPPLPPRIHISHLIILIRIPLPLLHNLLSKASSARIKLLTVLISHLPTTLTTSILPSLRESLVQITTDNPLVQLRAAHVLHAVQRILVRVVLDEAETAGRLVEAVQAHDEAFDAAAFAEQLVDLFFSRVEGEVADVEGCRVLQLVHWVGRGRAVVVRRAAFALVLR